MAEDIGIGGRAGYYDGIGSARDVIQNHLLQLLALTAMEEPASFDAESLLAEKLKVLKAVRLPEDLGRHTVRGQYAAGWQGGEKVPGYLEEEGIDPSSTTDTYAAIKLGHRQPPLGGRPFYLRTGKRLGRRVTEIAVVFQRAPHSPFDSTATEELGAERDRHPRPAGRGHDRALRFEGAGYLDGDPGRDDGLRLRRVVHRVQPGGVRTADPGCPARRRQPLPPPPGGGGVLEDPRPDRGVLGHARQARAVRLGQLGPRGSRRDARTRRTELAQAMKIDLTDTTASKINKALVQGRRAIGTPAVGMVLTMVIVTDEENAYDSIKAAEEASHEHPSRTLVVIKRHARTPRDRTKSRLDAEVRVGADAGTGETVVLRTYGEVVRPRRLAWSCRCCCRTRRSSCGGRWTRREHPAKDPLGALAQRRITDMYAVENPLAALEHGAPPTPPATPTSPGPG